MRPQWQGGKSRKKVNGLTSISAPWPCDHGSGAGAMYVPSCPSISHTCDVRIQRVRESSFGDSGRDLHVSLDCFRHGINVTCCDAVIWTNVPMYVRCIYLACACTYARWLARSARSHPSLCLTPCTTFRHALQLATRCPVSVSVSRHGHRPGIADPRRESYICIYGVTYIVIHSMCLENFVDPASQTRSRPYWAAGWLVVVNLERLVAWPGTVPLRLQPEWVIAPSPPGTPPGRWTSSS